MNRTAFRETGLSGTIAFRPAVPNLFQSAKSAVTKCDSPINTMFKCYCITKRDSYLIVRRLFQSAKQQTSMPALVQLFARRKNKKNSCL